MWNFPTEMTEYIIKQSRIVELTATLVPKCRDNMETDASPSRLINKCYSHEPGTIDTSCLGHDSMTACWIVKFTLSQVATGQVYRSWDRLLCSQSRRVGLGMIPLKRAEINHLQEVLGR